MVIDFHTHAFPGKIAARTLDALRAGIQNISGYDRIPVTDGTVDGLLSLMDNTGVDISVVMPIATKPQQTETINTYAARINSESGGRLLSFGSVHPADAEAAKTIDLLAESGFRGIKLHPEFQKSFIDSPESLAVLRRCAENGLAVTVHAGRDIGLPPPVHCTPDGLLHVLDAVPDITLIAAHLGGWMLWDEVAQKLTGTPLYFDTAFISEFISKDRARDIITRHTPGRVLLGSDCPWENPAQSVAFIRSLSLPADTESAVLSGNALKLLER